jgi:hypothetical protein
MQLQWLLIPNNVTAIIVSLLAQFIDTFTMEAPTSSLTAVIDGFLMFLRPNDERDYAQKHKHELALQLGITADDTMAYHILSQTINAYRYHRYAGTTPLHEINGSFECFPHQL